MPSGNLNLKTIYLLVVIQLFFLLGACGGSSSEDDSAFVTVTPSITEKKVSGLFLKKINLTPFMLTSPELRSSAIASMDPLQQNH